MSDTTYPADQFEAQDAPRLTLHPTVKTADGAEWVHKDYVLAVGSWAVERHLGPVQADVRFGDVESWAAYVARFAPPNNAASLLTWSERGLSAVLDYHTMDDAGRCAWHASHAFVPSPQWASWSRLANGQPVAQKQLVEALEDLAEDIVAPDAAALLEILRALRTTANIGGATTINPDGSTSVAWSKEAQVTAKAEIPPVITAKIPILKGHTRTGEDGRPLQVVYEVPVRLRPSVDDQARVVFRLSVPLADRILERVYADRVAVAQAALGDGFRILRAG